MPQLYDAASMGVSAIGPDACVNVPGFSSYTAAQQEEQRSTLSKVTRKAGQMYARSGHEANRILRKANGRFTNEMKDTELGEMAQFSMQWSPVLGGYTSRSGGPVRWADIFAEIDRGMFKLDSPTVAYRTMSRTKASEKTGIFTPGNEFVDHGYVSTSNIVGLYEGKYDFGAAGKQNSRSRLYLPKGASVFNPQQEELALGRGAVLGVMSDEATDIAKPARLKKFKSSLEYALLGYRDVEAIPDDFGLIYTPGDDQ